MKERKLERRSRMVFESSTTKIFLIISFLLHPFSGTRIHKMAHAELQEMLPDLWQTLICFYSSPDDQFQTENIGYLFSEFINVDKILDHTSIRHQLLGNELMQA